MGFRERPEYQDWRDAVFRLFGQTCIRCGHAGNIHAHHVMPVEDYPELAFKPTNGVPLCGNCHVALKGNELAHAADLKRLQLAIMGGGVGGTPMAVLEQPRESLLQKLAFAEPSNAKAVGDWFDVADARAVSDFYDRHREDSTSTAFLCRKTAGHLNAVGRWQDSIAVCDKAITILEQKPMVRVAEAIGSHKWRAMNELGRGHKAIVFLKHLVQNFTRSPVLHDLLSQAFLLAHNHTKEDSPEATEALDGYVRHATEAAQLAPREFWYALRSCDATRLHGDYRIAIEYGKRAHILASSCEQRTAALQMIAKVYEDNNLYADAIDHLHEALRVDGGNVGVVAQIAHCFFMDGNQSEAVRMAKHGLTLDQENQDCKRILEGS